MPNFNFFENIDLHYPTNPHGLGARVKVFEQLATTKLCMPMSTLDPFILLKQNLPRRQTSDALCFPLPPSPLVLRSGTHWELEGHAPPRQFPVDFAVGIEAMVDAAPLLLIQDDLQQLAAVGAGAGALADDFDGVDEVVEDGFVHGGQGAAAGPLLCLARAATVRALRAREDAPHGEEDDLPVGKLLLELAGEAGRRAASVSAVRDHTEVWSVCTEARWFGRSAVGRNQTLTAVALCGSQQGEERGRR